jgi:hypothetical protein
MVSLRQLLEEGTTRPAVRIRQSGVAKANLPTPIVAQPLEILGQIARRLRLQVQSTGLSVTASLYLLPQQKVTAWKTEATVQWKHRWTHPARTWAG